VNKSITYIFQHKGEKFVLDESEIAFCFPSVIGDGSYFFTLKDGQRFRGEQVKELTRPEQSPLALCS
jgi:hypothetical protein